MERPDSGFTLIELLIVVVIFSLLAFFVSGNVLSSFESARSASNTQIPIPEEITLVALMLE